MNCFLDTLLLKLFLKHISSEIQRKKSDSSFLDYWTSNQDYFSILLSKGNVKYLVREASRNSLEIQKHSEENKNQSEPISISYTNLKEYRLEEVLRKYKQEKFRYKNLYHYLFCVYPDVIKYHLSAIRMRFEQWAFDKKNLILPRRVEILRKFANLYKEGETSFDHNDLKEFFFQDGYYSKDALLSCIVGEMILISERKCEIENEFQLFLDSFVEAGELEKGGIGYKVTGKAVTTLSEYEVEETRHEDNYKIQRSTRLLTAVLALVGIIQTWKIDWETMDSAVHFWKKFFLSLLQ